MPVGNAILSMNWKMATPKLRLHLAGGQWVKAISPVAYLFSAGIQAYDNLKVVFPCNPPLFPSWVVTLPATMTHKIVVTGNVWYILGINGILWLHQSWISSKKHTCLWHPRPSGEPTKVKCNYIYTKYNYIWENVITFAKLRPTKPEEGKCNYIKM